MLVDVLMTKPTQLLFLLHSRAQTSSFPVLSGLPISCPREFTFGVMLYPIADRLASVCPLGATGVVMEAGPGEVKGAGVVRVSGAGGSGLAGGESMGQAAKIIFCISHP